MKLEFYLCVLPQGAKLEQMSIWMLMESNADICALLQLDSLSKRILLDFGPMLPNGQKEDYH